MLKHLTLGVEEINVGAVPEVLGDIAVHSQLIVEPDAITDADLDRLVTAKAP